MEDQLVNNKGEMAILYNNWGGSGELHYENLRSNKQINPEKIILKQGELLIKVLSISINPIDWKVLSGSQSHIAKASFPRIFGSDFSGLVYKRGDNKSDHNFSRGTRVFGMVSPLNNGSGRQWLVVNKRHCLEIPETMSFQEAASLPAAGISAILATQFADKKEPGHALVIGAGGGVGTLVVQILRKKGWTLTALCRKEQEPLLKELGCKYFMNRNSWNKLGNEKWDAIVDCPGLLITNKPSKHLLQFGYYSSVYIPDSYITQQIVRTFLWFFRSISTGLFLAYPSSKRLDKLSKQIENGLKPIVHSTWSVLECHKAVEKSMKGGITGKIVIDMERDSEELWGFED